METGQLLQKSSPDRKVTSYYERSEVDYILPIMTSPFDIKKARYVVGVATAGRGGGRRKIIVQDYHMSKLYLICFSFSE